MSTGLQTSSKFYLTPGILVEGKSTLIQLTFFVYFILFRSVCLLLYIQNNALYFYHIQLLNNLLFLLLDLSIFTNTTAATITNIDVLNKGIFTEN